MRGIFTVLIVLLVSQVCTHAGKGRGLMRGESWPGRGWTWSRAGPDGAWKEGWEVANGKGTAEAGA